VTSLGLALATWESRSSRVLAFSVGAVVAVTIGAPAVAFALFPRGEFGQSIAMASPFWGVGLFSSVIEHRSPTHMWPRILASALFWIAAYTATAVVLLAATLATFDRCLGRISDRSSRPTLNPSARSLRKPVPVLVDEC
ncbi:MAG: hypothetical protein ACJ8DJ_05465, partial [Gemmatimonadales bacterium]